jgi:hypothetical protein
MSCPPIPARRLEGEAESIEDGRAAPPCFPLAGGMCYNHRAVEHGAKRRVVPISMEPAEVVSGKTAQEEPSRSAVAEIEDVSLYCPVCSQRLESRQCKLICGACGYYMSCADFY